MCIINIIVGGLEITFANNVDKFVFTSVREVTVDAEKFGCDSIHYYL